ncbi:MAG TPA: bifunctional hydroxymethylpyrimidine kinase/phosphomethylpyrimidine kinase [Marinobacterium sp.]|nr:bifunctional hydroxymethylpyrimidine kinase/phosphomethylpyrimidine kinase [Marinobacterium sp.]
MTHIVLTIAGSDSGGGAGIQADLKTFSALGCYGASVITAVTAQNTRAVTGIHAIPTALIQAQIEAVLSDLRVNAIKIGMLGDCEVIRAVADSLRTADIPIILDPVMVAKSGDRLLQEDAVAALISELLPLATLVTPNLPEAIALLGGSNNDLPDDIPAQGKAILAKGARAVLMKGGHADGAECVDQLIQADRPVRSFTSARIDTPNTHGTGCTLSAAIAAGLAQGLSLEASVEQAHRYLAGAIRAADTLQIGRGHGPVHHFHHLWNL